MIDVCYFGKCLVLISINYVGLPLKVLSCIFPPQNFVWQLLLLFFVFSVFCFFCFCFFLQNNAILYRLPVLLRKILSRLDQLTQASLLAQREAGRGRRGRCGWLRSWNQMWFQLPPKTRNAFCFVECVWQPVPEGRCSRAEPPCAWVLFVCLFTQSTVCIMNWDNRQTDNVMPSQPWR